MPEYTEKQKQLIDAYEKGDWDAFERIDKPETVEVKIRYKHCEVCGNTCTGDRCQLHNRGGLRKQINRESTIKFQNELIKLVASSHKRKDIAKLLRISQKTVDWHMNRASLRVGIESRDIAGWTKYAIKSGLITLCLMFCLSVFGQPPIPVLQKAMAVASTNVTPQMTTVQLSWDKSPDTNVVGYRIYQGVKSLTFTNSIFVGNVTDAFIDSPSGITNYYVATSLWTNGVESVYSIQTAYLVPVTLKKTIVTFQAIIQTNSTLNTNLWGNYYTYPVYTVTNPVDFNFYRVDLLINTSTQ